MWDSILRWLRRQSPVTTDRNYFIFGVPTEIQGTVVKTPHKQQFPFIYGKVLFAMKITATQRVPVSLAWKDGKGNPALVDTAVFMVQSTEVVAITGEKHEVVNGGTVSSCYFNAVGPVGVSSVSLQGDVDLGDGVKLRRFDGQIQVVAGQASAGELVFGEAEEIPEVDPAPPVTPPNDENPPA